MRLPEQVSSDDCALLFAAQAEVQRAQAIVDWLQAQMARRYAMGPGDVVTPSGAIVRAEGREVHAPAADRAEC